MQFSNGIKNRFAFPLAAAILVAGVAATAQTAKKAPAPRKAAATAAAKSAGRTWAADNGNGTFSNPLFYDEFSDPDMIRVGDDYYLTGTTMHTMPGLPVLHSRDMVNWTLLTYAFDRLDLGPAFRMEGGRGVYGAGIWAPCFRYHDGTFYIFANVNGFGLQVFRSKDPKGPWARNQIDPGLHDISVLFDDDGKIYAVYGATTIHIVELNQGVTAQVPNTDRVLIERNLAMGEGSHIDKIKGKYYIVSAVPGAHVPMKCARADKLTGPWEVETISAEEGFGIGQGYRPKGGGRRGAPPMENNPPNPSQRLDLNIHQGGIIETQTGEWWGWSMQDHNSVGRLTNLSPVTWENGWPYFGLHGNLRRTPAIWVKPNTGHTSPITSPYQRNDDFSGPKLANVWQWNHVPDDTKWSLDERKGYLRLHSLAGTDFWMARNTLTQRAIGPESTITTEMDGSGLKPGDIAGLALLNSPYAWLGVKREDQGFSINEYDHSTGKTVSEPISAPHVWMKVESNYDTEVSKFSYSTDGKTYKRIGPDFITVFQLTTFQGVRNCLFNYNAAGAPGGYADFNSFTVQEPRPRGLTKPIPVTRSIVFTDLGSGNSLAAVDGKVQAVAGAGTAFRVVDRGKGRISLQTKDGKYVSVAGEGKAGDVTLKAAAKPGDAETFQWVDLHRGDTLLLSLATNRYIVTPKDAGVVAADNPGPVPDRKNGICFSWKVAAQ
jgi:xylan 1,4-beta-xylosidase